MNIVGAQVPVPCVFCGVTPTVTKVTSTWWDVDHDDCGDEPGISICNSPTSDSAVLAWNRWNARLKKQIQSNGCKDEPAAFAVFINSAI
jgi:hypothetical protein